MKTPYFLILCFFLLASHVLQAQRFTFRGDTLNPRFYAGVGLFFPEVTTSLRVDSESGIGTDLSLEDDFKFDNRVTVFEVQAMVRGKRRSQFLLGFTRIYRNNEFLIDESFQFQDTVFEVGARADLQFDMDYYAFTWRYFIFEENRWNAGFSLGLRLAYFAAGIDATFNERAYARKSDVYAPAPMIGIHGAGYLTDRLLARYNLDFCQVSISGIDINVLETRASLEYFIHRNIGIGGAYSTHNYTVREVPLADDFQGRIIFEFSGFNLFLTARF
jgi:hypothetical protein